MNTENSTNPVVRIITGQIKPGQLDPAATFWRESVAPGVRQQKGFISARLVVDRPTNRVRSIATWETEADFEASVPFTKDAIARFGQFLGAPPVIEHFDLFAEVVKD